MNRDCKMDTRFFNAYNSLKILAPQIPKPRGS